MSDVAPRAFFLHGAGGGRGSWARQESRLDGSVVLALPGHPDGDAFDRVEAAAEWVLDEIAAGSGPRVLVGHSMGGQIAMECAFRAPEVVDAIAIIASGARIPVPERVFDDTRADFDGRCDRFARACLAEPDEDAVAAAAGIMREAGLASVLADYRAVDGWDGRARLAEIRQPALVIAGAADTITPLAMSEELARGLPNAVSAVVQDAGHFVMSEQPGAVNLLLAAFLARLEVTLLEP